MSKKINDLSEEELYKLVGSNVARLRKKAGMSQLALSMEMGNKSPGLVSAAELYTKKRHFNLVHLQKIAKILDVDICEFFRAA